ncbi:hypothetical protein HNQ50_002240 [Silvimonas terrae]|uniref:Nucleotidyltransferase-like protein n=1 Tax=Silvimonas terrae TaxID=300266 RepID=A0A840RGG0_9NEIS|nr:nucleotidyltransferase family protein [Silvimonas terrae]MBB5191510.1 hypothetical protein [Silvimonas terrae]
MVSPLQPDESLEACLRRMVRADATLMAQLACVRACGLARWCIAAGAVRNRVWQKGHEQTSLPVVTDVDVCYFDAALPVEHAQHIEHALMAAMPGVAWEVVNQAHAHRFNGLSAVSSLAEALANWPPQRSGCGWMKREKYRLWRWTTCLRCG